MLTPRQLQMAAGAAVLVALAAALGMGGPGRPLFGHGEVAGSARVIDGDSLRIGEHHIRLKGIDAPEGRQSCTRSGESYSCGEEARRGLRQLVDSRDVRCDVHETQSGGRLLATCAVGDRNLNRAMVESGLAVAYGGTYVREEASARERRLGLWAGEFERPGDWRRRHGIAGPPR